MFGALFSLAAVYGFLIKGVAYFIALPYLLVLGADLYRWRFLRGRERGDARSSGVMGFHAAVIVTGLALLTAYAVFCYLVFGDVFIRFRFVNELGGAHAWAIEGLSAYLHRFFAQPFGAFYSLLGVVFLLALVQGVLVLDSRLRGNDDERGSGGNKDGLRLVSVYFFAGMFCAVFAPTSLSAYQPLPLYHEEGRFILFLIPPAGILAAKFVGNLFAGEIVPRRFYGYRFVPRAVALGLLAIIALQSGLQPATFVNGIDRIEAARRAAVKGLVDNGNAVLILSTGRNHWEFNLYTGFDPVLRSRILLCDVAPIAAGRDAIVFVDRRQSAFLLEAYGDPNCDEELLALSKAQGNRTLLDGARIYLSFPPGPLVGALP